MAGSRALPDLVSRIRVDSSGVDQAINQLIGSFGRADLALAGVAAGIGLLVIGGKSMIDIAEKHESAQRGLEQAYASAGTKLSQYQGTIDDFIRTNRRYISDQSEVIEGFAKLTRSGLSQTEVQRAMNDAVDLAALKHISLTEAVNLLEAAEHGRMKGLIDLGITTAKYTDAEGNLIQSQHSVAQSMKEVHKAAEDGRHTLSEHDQVMNSLGNHWHTLALGPGKELYRAFDDALQIGDLFMQFLEEMGHDNPLWDAIDDRLMKMASWIKQYVLNPLQQASDELNANPVLQQAYKNYQTNTAAMAPRAAGGPVIPGGVYTVGEDGPETLVMGGGGGGGYVIPNKGAPPGGGGGGIYVTLNGASMDPWQVANEIAWAKKTRRL